MYIFHVSHNIAKDDVHEQRPIRKRKIEPTMFSLLLSCHEILIRRTRQHLFLPIQSSFFLMRDLFHEARARKHTAVRMSRETLTFFVEGFDLEQHCNQGEAKRGFYLYITFAKETPSQRIGGY